MNWKKLIDQIEELFLGRGTVFRFPATWPYEEKVDYMLIENASSPSDFSLLVSSGYKAGIVCLNLPKEADPKNKGISSKWLIENWNKWIYEESKVSDVLYTPYYHICDDGLIDAKPRSFETPD